MPLNTVQQHLKAVLNGITLPVTDGTGAHQVLNAYVTPPNPGNGMDPAAYIWGTTGDDNRRSMPRGPGFRKIKHEVDIWLIWFGPADSSDADSDFPTIIDTVCQALRTCAMPVISATDPQTGQVSNIEMIGERLRWDYAPVHAAQDQRWLVYTARVICDVMEQLQA